jgi:hypothetical protein
MAEEFFLKKLVAPGKTILTLISFWYRKVLLNANESEENRREKRLTQPPKKTESKKERKKFHGNFCFA